MFRANFQLSFSPLAYSMFLFFLCYFEWTACAISLIATHFSVVLSVCLLPVTCPNISMDLDDIGMCTDEV